MNTAKMDTILSFSGGLDSAYCLWRYLQDNPRKKLLVHHITLKNHSRRWYYEDRAVNNIPGFDYGNIKRQLWDTQVVALFVGIVLGNPKYKRVKYVIRPAPRDEYVRLGRELERRRELAYRIQKAVLDRELEMVVPIKDKWKKDLVKEMPDDLVRLTWSCRFPRDNGGICGACHTCKQLGAGV